MKGEWRAGLIGFISVGGFATVCILILTGGIIVDSMKDQTASYQSQLDSQLAVTSPPLPWPAAESVAVAPVAA